MARKRRERLEDLLVELGDADENVRKGAVIKLGGMHEPEALRAVKSALIDPSSSVRYYAKMSLQKMEGRFDAAELAAGIPLDAATRAKVGAVHALKGSGRVADLLPYLDEADPIVRATAAAVLCDVGSADAPAGDVTLADRATALLSDPNPRVIANAVEALERWGHAPALGALERLVFHDDARVKANVAKALFAFSGVKPELREMVLGRLREMVAHMKPWIRSSAVYALGAIGTPEAREILRTALDDPEKMIREQVQEALKSLEGRAAAPAAKPPAEAAPAPAPPTGPPIPAPESMPGPETMREPEPAPGPAPAPAAPPAPAPLPPPDVEPRAAWKRPPKPEGGGAKKPPAPPGPAPAPPVAAPVPPPAPPTPAPEEKPEAARPRRVAPVILPRPVPDLPPAPAPSRPAEADARRERLVHHAKRAALALAGSLALLVLVATLHAFYELAAGIPSARRGAARGVKPAPGALPKPAVARGGSSTTAEVTAEEARLFGELRDGVLAMKRIDYDAAEARFRALLALAPGNEELRGLLAAALFGCARSRLAAGDAAGAEAALAEARALREFPGMARFSAEILLQRGDLPAAEAALAGLAEASPDDAGLWQALGLTRLKAGRFAAAADALGRAALLSPADAKGRINHGRALLRVGKPDEAFAEVLAGVRLAPGPATYKLLLDIARETGKTGPALAAYRALLKERPDEPALLAPYADLLLSLGMHLQAKAALEKLLAKSPDDPDLHFKLALCHQAMADLPAMRRHVEAAAKARPAFFEARYALGLIRAREGKAEEAAREFEAALAANPDSEHAAVELARLHMDAERWAKAYAPLAALVARRPEAREAHLVAAQAAMKLVKPVEARLHFSAFLKLEPEGSPRAALVREALAKLR